MMPFIHSFLFFRQDYFASTSRMYAVVVLRGIKDHVKKSKNVYLKAIVQSKCFARVLKAFEDDHRDYNHKMSKVKSARGVLGSVLKMKIANDDDSEML